MAVLPILRWPDPRLAVVCAEVPELSDEIRQLAADLLETMYDAKGRGLAAPQVGALWRVFVMDPSWKTGAPAPVVMINPSVVRASNTVLQSSEGCLSIPGVMALVTRATDVRLRWTAPDGAAAEETLTGFRAICAQHEIDHLNGTVMLDRLAPEPRAALEAAYFG